MRSHIAAGINNGDPVVFTMANGLTGQAQHKGSMPTKTVRVTALLAALVLASIAVNALTIFADRTIRQRSVVAPDCSLVTEKTDRLACYGRINQRPAPHPFRGANAPALRGSL